jgi:hypothetical protein
MAGAQEGSTIEAAETSAAQKTIDICWSRLRRGAGGGALGAVWHAWLHLTLALAPPALSGLCIYYWRGRIAVPVSFFVVGVISSWIIGFFICAPVVWILDEAHLYKALGAFLTVVVVILLLLRWLFRVRPPSEDSEWAPLVRNTQLGPAASSFTWCSATTASGASTECRCAGAWKSWAMLGCWHHCAQRPWTLQPFHNGPIDGQVIDSDTKKPIAGAIAVAELPTRH